MDEKIIKSVQTKILDIFKIVTKVMDEHNLRYFAIGGTCLGAVRHKGFIPWDDDLDIAMPDEDYFKFISIAAKVLPSHLRIVGPDNCQHYLNFSIRISDDNTTFIEHQIIEFKDRFMGVWLDIMPLFGVPKEKKQRDKYCKKIAFYKKMNVKNRMPFKYNKSFLSKCHHLLFLPLKWFLPRDYWYQKWLKLVSSYHFDDSMYTGYVWRYKLTPNLIFPIKWFSSAVFLKFEDTVMACPVEYDSVLKSMFGEYLELPPVEKRINHSDEGSIIDLNKPYFHYYDSMK